MTIFGYGYLIMLLVINKKCIEFFETNWVIHTYLQGDWKKETHDLIPIFYLNFCLLNLKIHLKNNYLKKIRIVINLWHNYEKKKLIV